MGLGEAFKYLFKIWGFDAWGVKYSIKCCLAFFSLSLPSPLTEVKYHGVEGKVALKAGTQQLVGWQS